MTRWALGVEYLGTGFSGWQRLSGIRSVQGTLEAALSTVADQPVEVVCAGRTDAGVHALQQVVHFDSEVPREPYGWLLGSNSLLPPELSLRWVRAVSGDFHARYSALSRQYRYVIHNDRARSALLGGRTGWWARELDVAAMCAAVPALIGERDFSAFRDAQCQSPTPMRRLDRIDIQRVDRFVVIDVEGNAFLHHMVRNIVGTLAEVGWGRRSPAWVAEVLASRDRRRAGMTAPADGLYFVGPRYAPAYDLPPPPKPWFPAGL